MPGTTLGGYKSGTATASAFALPINRASATPVESRVQWPLRAAGSFGFFSIRIDANGTGRKFALRKNGADVFAISPADGTSGLFQNKSAPVHFAVSDTFDLGYTSTGTAPFVNHYSIVFYADSGSVGFSGPVFLNTVASTVSWSTLGSAWFTGSDANSKHIVRAPFTASNLMSYATANTATGSTTAISRKNGANGAQSVTVAAGATGLVEDTANSDSLAAGDQFGVQVTSGAGGSVSIGTVACTLKYTTALVEVPAGSNNSTFSASPGFLSPISYNNNASTPEASFGGILGVDGVLSNMRFFVSSNSMTGTNTTSFRVNGVTVNQTIAVGAGATGLFEDTTHTDAIFANDLCIYINSGGVSGTMSTGWGAMTFQPYHSMWQRQRHYLRR